MKSSQKLQIYNEIAIIINEIKESYKWLDLIDSYGWRLDAEIEHLQAINNNIIKAIQNINDIVYCSK